MSLIYKTVCFFLFFLSILSCNSLHSIEICISKTQANLLSQRIFINETDLKQSKLLQWNQKENFLSLGIAHFIWYPKGQKKRFVESFPLFLTYLQKTGHTLPSWLSDTTACPWQSGKEFYSQLDSAKKKQLYKFFTRVQTRADQLLGRSATAGDPQDYRGKLPKAEGANQHQEAFPVDERRLCDARLCQLQR